MIKKVAYLFLIGISICLFMFVVGVSWISYDVKNQCQSAEKQYNQKCPQALILRLNDESASFKDRNSAIWALGQLGDISALPSLEKYYTGNIPSKEPLEKNISQYELKKAINLVKGGLNITSFLWR